MLCVRMCSCVHDLCFVLLVVAVCVVSVFVLGCGVACWVCIRCKGVLLRQGVAQLRHLSIETMWAQQSLQRQDVTSVSRLGLHRLLHTAPSDLHHGIVQTVRDQQWRQQI